MKFTRLLQYITLHRNTLLLVLLLLIADSLAALAQPWLAGQLTSAVSVVTIFCSSKRSCCCGWRCYWSKA